MRFQQLSNCVQACVRSADVSRRPAIREDGLTPWHVLEGLACATFFAATFWLLSAIAAGH
jgi:hypothetical protein